MSWSIKPGEGAVSVVGASLELVAQTRHSRNDVAFFPDDPLHNHLSDSIRVDGAKTQSHHVTLVP